MIAAPPETAARTDGYAEALGKIRELEMALRLTATGITELAARLARAVGEAERHEIAARGDSPLLASRNRTILQRVALGERQSAIAHELGLSRQRVSAIVRRGWANLREPAEEVR